MDPLLTCHLTSAILVRGTWACCAVGVSSPAVRFIALSTDTFDCRRLWRKCRGWSIQITLVIIRLFRDNGAGCCVRQVYSNPIKTNKHFIISTVQFDISFPRRNCLITNARILQHRNHHNSFCTQLSSMRSFRTRAHLAKMSTVAYLLTLTLHFKSPLALCISRIILISSTLLLSGILSTIDARHIILHPLCVPFHPLCARCPSVSSLLHMLPKMHKTVDHPSRHGSRKLDKLQWINKYTIHKIHIALKYLRKLSIEIVWACNWWAIVPCPDISYLRLPCSWP